MMPTPAALPQQEIVRLDGHLLDSMVLPKVLDAVADAGASSCDPGAGRWGHEDRPQPYPFASVLPR